MSSNANAKLTASICLPLLIKISTTPDTIKATKTIVKHKKLVADNDHGVRRIIRKDRQSSYHRYIEKIYRGFYVI